jgi:hypothetical protein
LSRLVCFADPFWATSIMAATRHENGGPDPKAKQIPVYADKYPGAGNSFST